MSQERPSVVRSRKSRNHIELRQIPPLDERNSISGQEWEEWLAALFADNLSEPIRLPM